ncbi:sulfite exporter TauE/SafE family protein [Segnochrobactrum spirostomi]|uniref:Probable membrane transporter protein n=1 Tax=Segnochrobactrum spirostomi TaxID=2608987 RepID=A0A6A7Y065_9HYPH|nr:sulfite exporter TauE/SafE family protein [Segnochrobactrum spirostomi]MQT11986.1 sulfite exporter TauE/SafE family protein [Segnochrobactrum spirostomi]
MTPALLPAGLAIGSGGLIGLVLGLIGGGGSILAVPLLVYGVGVASPHVAIGTAAVAVALNAGGGLAAHARQHTIKWRCALVFAATGVVGALVGSAFGKAMDGERLLALFGAVMIGVGLLMLRPRRGGDRADVRLDSSSAAYLLPRLIGIGFAVGVLAGFFGIGGGFLIVPGLIAATRMPLRNAIGTSLVSVAAFGVAGAASYAASGYVDWPLAALVIVGGLAGSLAGTHLGTALAGRRGLLTAMFSAIVITVGIYVVVRGLLPLHVV